MRAERLGSYSIAATLPGTPNLSRLKSIIRYLILPRPPRWRMVTRPLLLRPADCESETTRLRSGFDFVISAKSGVAI